MERYDGIKKLSVTTDGYVGGGYAVSLDFETGQLCFAENNLFYQQPKYLKTLDQKSLEAFKKTISTLEILDWQKKYYDLSCMDGPMWEMKVEMKDDGFEKFSGTAAYPHEWGTFCALICDVCQKTFK